MQIYDAKRSKIVRRIVAPSLGPKLMQEKLLKMKKHVLALVDDFATREEPIHLQNDLLQMSMKVLSDILLSESAMDGINPDDFKNNYDNVMQIALERQLGPLSQEKEQEMKKSSDYLHNIFTTIVNKPTAENENRTFLEILKTEIDPDTQELFSPKEIEMLLRVFVIAGYHTTIVAVTWTMYLLTQHLDVQEKCFEIVDKVDIEKLDTIQELEDLQYITNVLKEGMRLYSSAFGARLVEKNVKVGPYMLQKGSTVLYPFSFIHADPRLWKNPKEFDPDRHAKEINRLAFIPFGVGPRVCPGETVAWTEMRLLLVCLLKRFKFTLAMPVEQVIPVDRFALWAKNDIKVNVTER
jgi:cytochrome P450